MKSKNIWILIIFMAAIMISLIIVQIYWIKNALHLKEEQFNHLVNTSISNVVDHIRYQETLKQITAEVNETDTFFQYKVDFHSNSNGKIFDSSCYIRQNGIYIKHSFRTSFNQTGNESVSICYDTNSHLETKVNGQTILFSSSNVYTTVRKKNKKVARRNFVENVVKRLEQPEKSINERLPAQYLYASLKEAFENNDIHNDFEFAVCNDKNNVMLASANFTLEKRTRLYKTSLFPDDVNPNSNQLMVYFPNHERSGSSSLGFMSVSTIVLIIFILATFLTALIIIFRQKKLSEMKTDFVNNMTHELKTPISTISLASQMLGDKSVPVEMKNLGHISGVISKETDRLGQQVEKVLQMAIFEKGKIDLKKKTGDIHQIIENVADNFRIQLDNKDGSLKLILGAENSYVAFDEVHMTNVISNLMDNAIKYCDKNPEIEIETCNNNSHIELIVKDNGIGISKEDQKKVFDKFFRVYTGNIHNIKGFGLGLSYVKRIVDEHQGNISVESELNKGAAFKIELPQND